VRTLVPPAEARNTRESVSYCEPKLSVPNYLHFAVSGVPEGRPSLNAALNAAFTAAIEVPGTYVTKSPFTVAQNAAVAVLLGQAAAARPDSGPPATIRPKPPAAGTEPLEIAVADGVDVVPEAAAPPGTVTEAAAVFVPAAAQVAAAPPDSFQSVDTMTVPVAATSATTDVA
jgi:hypothetical protein